jgi:glycosyltransferase involved in cell wall biosynthesis
VARITVMHLRASNFVGGPEKQVLEHFVRLDKSSFRPLLCTFSEPGTRDELRLAAEGLGIECRSIPAVSPLNLSNILQLARLLKEEGVAILCTHGYKPNVLGAIACRLAGVRTIAVSRGWTGESAKIRCYEGIDRYFLRHVDHVVAVSFGQMKKVLSTGVKAEKASVIANGINLLSICAPCGTGVREQLGIPAAAVFVASAGRLSPEKNYAGMIEAARLASEGDSTLHFAIFGEGVLRPDLEARIAAAGLTGRFHLPGFRTDLQAVLHDIDIFMLPSFSEGLPNVALEAFAVRKPIVATAVGGTPEVVQDGVSGFLTAPDQTRAMGEFLVRLASDRDLRQRMGEAGYRHVLENFGFERQTEKYELLYRRVAGA